MEREQETSGENLLQPAIPDSSTSTSSPASAMDESTVMPPVGPRLSASSGSGISVGDANLEEEEIGKEEAIEDGEEKEMPERKEPDSYSVLSNSLKKQIEENRTIQAANYNLRLKLQTAEKIMALNEQNANHWKEQYEKEEQEMDQLKREKADEELRSKKELEDTRIANENKIAEMADRLALIDNQKSSAEEMSVKLENDLQQKEEQMTTQKLIAEAMSVKLKDELQQMRTQMEKAETSAASLTSHLKAVTIAKAKAESTVTTLTNSLEAMKIAKEKAEASVTSLKSDVKAMSIAKTLADRQIANLAQCCERLTNQKKTVEDKLAREEEAHKNQQALNNAIVATLVSTKDELADVKKEADENAKKLRLEHTETSAALETAKSKCKQLEQKCSSLQNEKAESDATISSLQKALKSSKKAVKAAKYEAAKKDVIEAEDEAMRIAEKLSLKRETLIQIGYRDRSPPTICSTSSSSDVSSAEGEPSIKRMKLADKTEEQVESTADGDSGHRLILARRSIRPPFLRSSTAPPLPKYVTISLEAKAECSAPAKRAEGGPVIDEVMKSEEVTSRKQRGATRKQSKDGRRRRGTKSVVAVAESEGPDAPKVTAAEQIALATTAAESFLRSTNHSQQALEDMLLSCYRAFPFSSKVEMATIVQQTVEQESTFLQCMLEGKFEEGQLHECIRKLLGLLRQQYWPVQMDK